MNTPYRQGLCPVGKQAGAAASLCLRSGYLRNARPDTEQGRPEILGSVWLKDGHNLPLSKFAVTMFSVGKKSTNFSENSGYRCVNKRVIGHQLL
jgi:hypothetical protein